MHMEHQLALKMLKKAVTRLFKWNSTVRTLESEIIDIIKAKIWRKYRSMKRLAHGMEYELWRVSVRFMAEETGWSTVDIELVYTVCSKLDKRRAPALASFKKKISKYSRVYSHESDRPLYVSMQYEVALEEALLEEINLEISIKD